MNADEIPNTSAEAYASIIASDLITEAMIKVVRTLYDHQWTYPEGMSQTDVRRLHGGDPGRTLGARFKQLEDRKVITVVGVKTCPHSNKTVKLYKLTSTLPVEPMKDPNVLSAKAAFEQLLFEVAEVRAQLPEGSWERKRLTGAMRRAKARRRRPEDLLQPE